MSKIQITDTLNLKNVGILGFKQEWLNTITKLSGSLAYHNEYQVHYWALVLRRKFSDESILDIAVPLVFFNYPQEVSPVHIDFEGKSVSDMSDETKEIATLKANELIDKLSEFIKQNSLEPLIVSKMTIHKHP